ncbi:hypothetical protein SDC9_179892 [bioreactor metagenome]|uniref:Uncharacterized protein n=1 Tax=bioreactor metagenome TaxID=1076179 RepID=A0A645H811_9ZZZZ
MWFVEILPRANGDNACRVNRLMAAEIVVANMVKIDRFRDAWHLINIAQETMQIEIVADAMLVAFEMRDIHRIKADECCPQANISLCKPITCQIAMLTEDLLQPRQRGKDVFYRVIIGLLTGSEARFIDAIVNVVINPAVQFVDLVAQFWGIVVPGFCPLRIERRIEHANDFSRFITDNRMVLFIPQDRHGDAAAVMGIGVQVKLIQKFVLI